MIRYLKELENYSYPLHRDDLYAITDEEFIKINDRNQLEAERIGRYVEKLEVEKISLEKSWNSFVSRIRWIDGFLRVTDRTPMAFTYSFKVEVVLQNSLGIGFCLSQIGKLIGIYFTSQKINALIPFKNSLLSLGDFLMLLSILLSVISLILRFK